MALTTIQKTLIKFREIEKVLIFLIWQWNAFNKLGWVLCISNITKCTYLRFISAISMNTAIFHSTQNANCLNYLVHLRVQRIKEKKIVSNRACKHCMIYLKEKITALSLILFNHNFSNSFFFVCNKNNNLFDSIVFRNYSAIFCNLSFGVTECRQLRLWEGKRDII